MTNDNTANDENEGTEETVSREVDLRKLYFTGLVFAGVLIATMFLQRDCIGKKLGFGGDENNIGITNGDDNIVAYNLTNIDLPPGCNSVELEGDKLQIECDDDERLKKMLLKILPEVIREVIVDERCNPTDCDQTTTEFVPPRKTKTSCSAYAKKTGKSYQCLDSRKYRGRSNSVKHGLCPGKAYMKCMIPGPKKKRTPVKPTPIIPNETSKMDTLEITCEGKQCNEFYTGSLLRKPGARIITPGASNQGDGHVLVPSGVRTLTIEVPAGTKLDYVNANDMDGSWSVRHDESQMDSNGKVTAEPTFKMTVKRNGRTTHRLGRKDSVKIKDFSYKVDQPNPVKSPPVNSDGAYDYTK